MRPEPYLDEAAAQGTGESAFAREVLTFDESQLLEQARIVTEEVAASISGIEDQAKRRALAQRLLSKAGRLWLKTNQIAVFTAIVLAGNYEMTKESVTEGKDREGEATYEHSDPETDHILNYLTGKEALSERERIKIMLQLQKNHIEACGVSLPEGYDDFAIEEYADFYAMKVAQHYPDLKKKAEEKGESIQQIVAEEFRWKLDEVPISYEFDKQTYQKYWQLERQVGAPKIRWQVRLGSHDKPHYDIFNHTMYIYVNQGSAHQDLIAEAAHSDQFRNQPVASYLKGAASILRVAFRTAKGLHSPYDVYDIEYREPGSIEHDAHSVREPAMVAEFGQRVPAPREKKPEEKLSLHE